MGGHHTECCQCEKSATDISEMVAPRLTRTLELNNKQSNFFQSTYFDFFEERETYFKNNKNGERPRNDKGGQGRKNRETDAERVARHRDLEAKLSKVLTIEQMTE